MKKFAFLSIMVAFTIILAVASFHQLHPNDQAHQHCNVCILVAGLHATLLPSILVMPVDLDVREFVDTPFIFNTHQLFPSLSIRSPPAGA